MQRSFFFGGDSHTGRLKASRRRFRSSFCSHCCRKKLASWHWISRTLKVLFTYQSYVIATREGCTAIIFFFSLVPITQKILFGCRNVINAKFTSYTNLEKISDFFLLLVRFFVRKTVKPASSSANIGGTVSFSRDIAQLSCVINTKQTNKKLHSTKPSRLIKNSFLAKFLHLQKHTFRGILSSQKKHWQKELVHTYVYQCSNSNIFFL